MKAIATLGAVLLLAACSGGAIASGTSTPSASPVPSPLAGPSGKLNAEVPMPAGFPADFPIYPKSRLTSGAAFVSTGQASWGMEWQTLDPATKVYAFYASKLPQGDWAMALKSSTSTAFTANFQRKSTSAVTGTLSASTSNGLTRILISLVSASA